jgi:hypothetical protein
VIHLIFDNPNLLVVPSIISMILSPTYSRFHLIFKVIVGKLAKLTSNLIQKIESNGILVTIFMNICDLTEYSNM